MAPRPSVRTVRPSWPLVLLFASLGATAIAAIEAHRTVRSQRALAEHALRDYAAFASWSYQQHLRVSLTAAVREVIGAVNHGDNLHTSPRIPDVSQLPHYLDDDPACDCHRPRFGPVPAAYFGFTLGADTLGVELPTHTPGDQSAWFIPPGEVPLDRVSLASDLAEQRWLNRLLTQRIRTRPASDWHFHILFGEWDDEARPLAYTLMPTTRGDTIVYGVTYTAEAFASVLRDVLDRDAVLPASVTQHRRNRDVVSIEVTDDEDRVLYASNPSTAWRFDATSELPVSYGALHVRAQMRPDLADEIIIGGLPRSRLPFLVALLVLSAALGVVAVMQLRREQELAAQRARFVSGVSHELRTPLAQIRLYLETLRLGRYSSEAQRERSLEQIDRETRRLAHLVDNVLRFSRRGTGITSDVARAPVDVGAEVQDVANEFGLLAAARRATINVDVRTNASIAMAPGSMRQVLINLLDNAIKYGPPEQIVRVTVDADDRIARIEISDEGPGVPESERESIFEPFRRGGAAATSGAGGSGIGLTIVRDIAEAHGGRVFIAPSLRGAHVVVEIPRLSADSLTTHADAAAPVAT